MKGYGCRMQTEAYSVLMAVYHKDDPGFFRAAADSMLSQTTPPAEFVLVCDGPLSPELDAEINELAARCVCRLHVIRLPKCGGLGIALRTGVEQCTYELIARMDSDDISVPDRMESQLEYLQLHPETAAVGGQIAEFFTSNAVAVSYRCVPCDNEQVRTYAARRNPMNHMTVTFRRSDVLSAGNYRSFDRFEDYDLWARMLGRGCRLENLDRVMVYARITSDTYRRRGGFRYFRQTVQMQKQLRACGLIGVGGYWRNLLIRFAGTVLLPNSLRSAVYRRHLRGKASGGGLA